MVRDTPACPSLSGATVGHDNYGKNLRFWMNYSWMVDQQAYTVWGLVSGNDTPESFNLKDSTATEKGYSLLPRQSARWLAIFSGMLTLASKLMLAYSKQQLSKHDELLYRMNDVIRGIDCTIFSTYVCSEANHSFGLMSRCCRYLFKPQRC